MRVCSVCSRETFIPKSAKRDAKRETVSHAPVGLRYYAVNASSGMPLKVFTEQHNVLKQTYYYF